MLPLAPIHSSIPVTIVKIALTLSSRVVTFVSAIVILVVSVGWALFFATITRDSTALIPICHNPGITPDESRQSTTNQRKNI